MNRFTSHATDQTAASAVAPAADHTPRQPRFVQIGADAAAADRAELLRGLTATPPRVAPKFLYDRLGSRLFEAITELDEYYPTRTEAAVFERHAGAMASAIGPIGSLLDLGAGNCQKALALLPHLRPGRYVAVDISVAFLRDALTRVQQAEPELDVVGLGLDFSRPWRPPVGTIAGRPVFFYPGSSIGNFAPDEAIAFLTGLRELAGGGGLLIGIDLVKPTATLEAAYDDALGVTAAFNLNLLRHLNRVIGTDFDPRQWRHIARYDAAASRIEMHLEARETVTVSWPGGGRRFDAGVRLHTENSHKYTEAGVHDLLVSAGFRPAAQWLDDQRWFGVFWATA